MEAIFYFEVASVIYQRTGSYTAILIDNLNFAFLSFTHLVADQSL